MPKKHTDAFGFFIDLCRAVIVVGCVAATLLTAEVYLSNGKMLSDAEIANGCSPCGASMALATRKNNNRAPN
jgi:hypothetical protein